MRPLDFTYVMHVLLFFICLIASDAYNIYHMYPYQVLVDLCHYEKCVRG